MNEQEKQLAALMAELEGKERIEAEQCTRLFNLHNFFFTDLPEYNKSCPACRERVWNRMKKFWSDKNTKR
jgi:hypothetical protein